MSRLKEITLPDYVVNRVSQWFDKLVADAEVSRLGFLPQSIFDKARQYGERTQFGGL